MLSTFSLKSIRPIQKFQPVLAFSRLYSTKSLEVNNSHAVNKLDNESTWWSDQDTDKLFNLVEEHGNDWTSFANYFPGRTKKDIREHYYKVKHKYLRWTQTEKSIMQELAEKENDFGKIDWEHVQQSLPRKKPMSVIQHFYRLSIDPSFVEGKWTNEEIQRLFSLANEYGKDWRLVSGKIGTRNEFQCRRKYWYELNKQNAKDSWDD